MFKLAAFSFLTAIATDPAGAQQTTYPNAPVRIISDSAAGSNIDVNMRILADRLSQVCGQQAVVINHPGAGGAISARIAAEAKPDGYTLYMPALSVFLAVPGKAPNLPLQLPRDFTAIGYFADNPMFIAASPTLGISTLKELIDLAKKKPGSISYAVSGVGRLTHLTGELLQSRAGIKLQMVPYTGGSAHAINDVIGGRIPMIIDGYAGALGGAIEGGRLKALAHGGPARLAEFPGIAPASETLPGFVASGWQVLVAPVGTPNAIIRKASADLQRVLNEPDMKKKLAARGAYARPMTPEQTREFVQSQQTMWKPAIEQVASYQKTK
jgi:tripartite-type tricarboxylate transporter receptor subunit TctC